MCPFEGSRFKSRSFTAFQLKTGLNWSQFLGLGDIAPSAQSRMHPLQDVNVKWTIELPVVRLKSLTAINEVITSVENRSQAVVHRDEAVEDEDGTIRFKAKLTDQHSDSYEDGDDSKTEGLEAPLIRVVDSDGNPIVLGEASDAVDEVDTDEEDFLDIDGGGVADALDRDERDALRPKDTQGRKATPRRSSRKRDRQSDTVKDANEELEGMMDDELEIDAYGLNEQKDQELEEAEAKEVIKYRITTDGYQSYQRVCKIMNAHHKELQPELHSLFRIWLLTKPNRSKEKQLTVDQLSLETCNTRTALPKGIIIPYPSGPHWQRLKNDIAYKKETIKDIPKDELEEEHLHAAMRAYCKQDQSQNPGKILSLCQAIISGQSADATSKPEVEDFLNLLCGPRQHARKTLRRACKVFKKKRQSIATQADPAPRSINEALMGERAEEWLVSINKEWDGLCEQGVFSHDHTLADLRKMGIMGKPVPCSTALTHKYKDGILEKLKTRICIAGHKGNVTKGIHYSDVFSPSPIQHPSKPDMGRQASLHTGSITRR